MKKVKFEIFFKKDKLCSDIEVLEENITLNDEISFDLTNVDSFFEKNTNDVSIKENKNGREFTQEDQEIKFTPEESKNCLECNGPTTYVFRLVCDM